MTLPDAPSPSPRDPGIDGGRGSLGSATHVIRVSPAAEQDATFGCISLKLEICRT